MPTSQLPNQPHNPTDTNILSHEFSPSHPREVALSPSSITSSRFDSLLFSQSLPPSSPPPQPREHEEIFSFRSPSPHPELSPPTLSAHSRSWSRSSSSRTASSPRGPTRHQRRGSSLYFTPAGSIRSWNSQPPPPPLLNPGPVPSESPVLRPRIPLVRGGADAASVSSGVLSGASPTQRRAVLAQAHFSIQRRYTEDWVHHLGYQQHRRENSWYFDPSESIPNSNGDHNNFEVHRRNPSNAKTITPADFQAGGNHRVPGGETDLSSDNEIETTGGRTYRTAPQSLVESRAETPPPPMPMLQSKWATMVEEESSAIVEPDYRLGLDKSNLDFSSSSGPGDTSMLRTPSSSTATSGVATATPLLDDRSLPISRMQSPNPRSSRRWNGKNVIIQIPAETRWGIEGGRPMPLSKSEIQEKMGMWELRGYSVEIRQGGQSREVFPPEVRGKLARSDVIVCIPDRRDWQVYVDTLREQKLRALGVFDDEPPSAVLGGRGQTPLSHQSPAQYNVNPFSPPAPTASAMSGANGSMNHFSPPMMATSGTSGYSPAHISSPMGAAAAIHNPHMSFHMSRQSMSMSNSPMDPNEWGPPYSMFTPPPPPPQMPTPPVPNGSGVWSPPFSGRNGSPMGLYSHSPSYSQSPNMGMYGPTYQMETKIDYNSLMFSPEPEANQRMQHHNHHHSIVGVERYHQQQMRRGSPLAQPLPEEDNEAVLIGGHGPMIDAPVPKHRHQLSISLQKELEGVENYQRQNGDQRQTDVEMNPEGFNTNPVSPAPVVTYPEQPEIPHIEHDVHNGPELQSNPDDDVSDEEAEKNLNRKVALERERDLEAVRKQSYPEETALAMPEVEVPGSQHYVSQQYTLPRSRENSLGHMQHDHGTAGSKDHSAMQISYSRFGLKYDHQPSDWLSEGARTNISEEDMITNPSQPPSPQRDFANPTNSNSHAHHMSNNSNAWTSDNAKPTASVTSSTSKFNAQAKEFEFRPSSFSFSPKIAPFIPSGSVTSSPISGHSRNHSRNQSGGGFSGFGLFGSGFNAAAATFRPSFLPGSNSSLFEKGAAAFSPNAPPFTPSSLAKSVPASQPPPSAATRLPPIFSPVDTSSLPHSVKKVIPIRPPSRLNVHPETEAEESTGDRKVGPSVDEGGGKRAKHGPTLGVIKDTEAPSLEALTPTKETAAELEASSDDATAVVESGDESEGEKLIKAVSVVPMGEEVAADGTHSSYTFKNSEETTGFAMADTIRLDGPSRRQSRFDVLGSANQMSVEEAQFVVADSPRDNISERSATPRIEAPPKRFNPNAKFFSFKPTAQEFNSESTPGPNPPSPLPKKFGGMGDSRYAHTPSPPPSHPAPLPPSMLDNVPAFTPPTETSPYSANTDPYKTNAFGEPILRPMPSDAELDEVVRHLDVADPIFADQGEQAASSSDGEVIGQEQEVEEEGEEEEGEDRVLSPWRREGPKRMGIPDFEPTPRTTFHHLDRSAGPSPSPRRATGAPYIPHRASSFSPDEAAEYGRTQTTTEPPTQEGIGIAKDPDSDWDSMVSASEDPKLRPQSRLFFDAHVEDLVGGLLRSNLEPMNKNITAIHEVLRTYSSVYGSRSQRGSNISASVNSDADDEDDNDNITQPPRSPRKDRRSEKIKSAVVEALSMHNWSAPVEDKLAEIYGAIAKVSRAFQDGNLNGDQAETSASILDAILKTAQGEEVAAVRDAVLASIQAAANSARELGEFRAMFVNSFSKLAQVQDVNALRDSLEEMFSNIPSPGDLVDVKLGLQEILVKTAQRGDVGELHAAITRLAQVVARGEDLDHFQNVAIEAFSKLVKPNDLVELKSILSEIQRSVTDVNLGTEVRKLSLDNATLRSTLDEVLKLTQDTAENVDFHQESQESIIKDNHEAVRDTLNIMQSSIRDVANLVRSRVPENDLHSSLYNENFAQIKLAIENVRKGMQVSLESQRGLYGLKDVVEKVSDSQPGLGRIKEAISEVTLPGLQDIKTTVEGFASTQPKLDDFRGVVEELLLKHNAGVGRVESRGREVELETRLRIAEEECARQREFVEERDRRLKAVEEKRHQTLTQTHMRSVLLEGAHSSLQRSVTDLSTKNVTLESSVREAQQTSDRLREDNQKLEEENRELRRAIDTMRTEMEESIRVRENHRGKFDKMQEDITTAAEEIGKEQSKWQRTHEEQKARIEVLEAKLQAELTTKEILGGEVRRLEIEQKEAIRMKVEFEQVKKANGKMEEMLAELKKEAMETQKRMAALGAEVEQARGKATQKRTSTEATAVQTVLEEEIEIAHDRIDRLTEEAALEREKATLLLEETVKAHEVMLREAEEAKATIIKEAAEAKSTALHEQHRRFERQLEAVRSKQEELRYQSERAARIAAEDLEREKYLSSERLSIASSESKSLREYISHLKEQVQVATSAAQAAAQAATSAKLLTTHPTQSAAEERALRESVEVLQNQLQQREARIEQLEQELSQFDKTDAKRKDEQITWLRELLEVRVDELEEIVHSLGLPYFDRESIRDAALRLKTNLQMEQQEKERTLRNEATPATNVLTSRLPAWASWRGKGTGTPSQASSTPSRPTSAAGFLNGILTPPSGALANAQRFGSRLARGSSTPDDSTQKFAGSARQREKQPARRAQLFGPASYDADADSSVFSGSQMYGGEDDDATERGEDDDRDLGTIGLGLYKRH